MLQSWRAEAGQVIPFLPASGRERVSSEREAGESRGVVLLFTGVRYERMADPAADGSLAGGSAPQPPAEAEG